MALLPGGEPIRMPVSSSRFSSADFTSASASSHFHVPRFGSSPRHSGKRRTLVTPATVIFGNHSAWFLNALADELTPQGVGLSPKTAALMERLTVTLNRIRVRLMENLPEQARS